MKKLSPKQQEWSIKNNLVPPIKCKMCDNFVKWNSTKNEYQTYCSPKCYHSDSEFVSKKRKQTNLERWGGNPLQNEEIKKRIKQINLGRYGFENPSQNEEVQKKKKRTNLTGYNGHPSSLPETKNKKKQTNEKKYGFSNPLQNAEIRKKSKQTCLERHGVEHPCQSPEIEFMD
jgi:hypothetical protein